MKHRLRVLALLAIGVAVSAVVLATNASAVNDAGAANRLGFVPLADGPQHCSATSIEWSPSITNASIVMQRGDAATPTANAFSTQTTVPGENDMIAFSPDGHFLFAVAETGTNGAVTKLDLQTGAKTILSQRADWNRLDPIKWYAPAGTLLIGEEDGNNGSMWQVNPDTGSAAELPWLGKMSHEGIGFGTDGSIWLGDENHKGAIYKAVPAVPSDLTQGGTLSAMVVGSGFFAVDPANAVNAAYGGGATLFDRPEDFDQRNGRIYFTVTEPADDAALFSTPEHPVQAGGVYSVNDAGTPTVQQFVALDDPATGDLHVQVPGLQFPDNLAFDRKGNLWVHEDIPDDTQSTPTNVHSKQYRDMQDELLVALPDNNGDGVSDGVYKFANMGNSASANPCQNEWTGGAFLDNGTFFVNQQHADSPTWRVTIPWGKSQFNP
jgi:secreted PhoX family phosphatase